jgi:hypothetical protein
MPKTSEPKDIVLSFLDALNTEDFETVRSLLADDMTFDGVMGKRDGADAYVGDMQKMKFKYELIKAFADGNDVCVLYNIDMGKGDPIYSAGWYTVKYGKIKTFKVVFDPRPLLDKK